MIKEGLRLNDLFAQAEALKTGNEEFPLQISHTDDGADVNKAFPWVYADELEDLDDALEFARNPLTPVSEAIACLEDAIVIFNGKIKADGSDPYFRLDPGPGRMAIDITAPTNVWIGRDGDKREYGEQHDDCEDAGDVNEDFFTYHLGLLLFLRQPLKSRFRVTLFLFSGFFTALPLKMLFWLKILRFYVELTIHYPSVSHCELVHWVTPYLLFQPRNCSLISIV